MNEGIHLDLDTWIVPGQSQEVQKKRRPFPGATHKKIRPRIFKFKSGGSTYYYIL